jgi:Zn-dependent peptidase ImmA (M78 family)
MEDLEGKFPKIRQWSTGKDHPTLRQLESLSKATLTPLGFFFLAEPPEERLPIPYYRTVKEETPTSPTPDLLETIHTMQRRQDWMREFLLDQGHDRIRIVKSARLDEDTTVVADKIRQTLGFDKDWASEKKNWTDALGFLREAIEAAEILVIVNGIVGNNTHRKLDVGEFRGFVLVDDYAPLIFVNGADGKAAQMFTLAHELVHVFFGSSAAFDLREMQPADNPTEKACNRVAAEFLVPEKALRRIWNSAKEDAEPFQVIAQQFKVSALVAARRALDLRLIKKNEFLDFYRQYQQDERRVAERRPGGGDFYANQNMRIGRRFGKAVVQAAQEGKLLYSEAYHLTGLYGKTFDGYVTHLKTERR